MKTIFRVLLALGSVVMLFALFMDTTVETGYGRVHNIGLQSERQLFFIFGCFLVLVGVILFALHKLKQTPAHETAEVEARQAEMELVKEAAHQTSATIAQFGTGLFSKFRKAKADDFDARLFVGIFVALCTLPVSTIFLNLWWVLPLIVLLYSLRDRPAFYVMTSMLKFNVYWTLLQAVILTVFLVLDLPFLDYLGPLALSLSCTGISLAALSYVRRRQSRMSLREQQRDL